VAADAVAVDRTVVDTWYATAAQGTLAGTAVQSVVGTAPITATGTTTRTVGINAASGSNPGSMSSADFTKLAGIATGATANDTDANLKNRANHTGTQAGSTVTGLYTASGMTLATARLLGRSTAGTGAAQEIALGTGLSFAGSTLNVAAGATNLDGLSDVTITAAATDQTLIRDAAGQFRNQPLPAPARSEYYLWKTAAQTVDPGAGGIGGNNDIWESSTVLHVNQAALDGTLMTSWYSSFKKGMRFLIQNRANPTSYIAGIITATPTNQTGYSTIPVQITETNGGEPTADTPVVLQINSATVLSDPTAATGADQITNMISLTQAEYDAIGTKSATTLYVIT
jgi:hypothetical protein